MPAIRQRATYGLQVVVFPSHLKRVILSHTQPESVIGLLRRIDTGPATTKSLGYISRGGTLDVPGMLFANHCTWAHAVEATAHTLDIAAEDVLTTAELGALRAQDDPSHIIDGGLQ